VAAGAAAVVEALGLAGRRVARLAGAEVAAAVRRTDALIVDADEGRRALAAARLIAAVGIARQVDPRAVRDRDGRVDRGAARAPERDLVGRRVIAEAVLAAPRQVRDVRAGADALGALADGDLDGRRDRIVAQLVGGHLSD